MAFNLIRVNRNNTVNNIVNNTNIERVVETILGVDNISLTPENGDIVLITPDISVTYGHIILPTNTSGMFFKIINTAPDNPIDIKEVQEGDTVVILDINTPFINCYNGSNGWVATV